MIEFLKTPAGKRFFDRDFPGLIKAVNRLAQAVEQSGNGPALGDLLDQWKGQLGDQTPRGMTQANLPISRVVCTTDPIPTGSTRKPPPGYVPLPIDESNITDAPDDARSRALLLALDNWTQSSPDERAEVVAALRDEGSMTAQRAATILALFVQFEDTAKAALKAASEPQT